MTIMIIDDNHERCRKIEEASKTLEGEIKTVMFHDLSSAIEFLKRNSVDGIVTDRSYPLEAGKEENKFAGIRLLEWLSDQKKEIPVLGNSSMQFVSDYPYYRGKMNGYLDMYIFYNFVSSIRNHD